MEHEATIYITTKSFQMLFITLRAQCADSQGLGLTASEQS